MNGELTGGKQFPARFFMNDELTGGKQFPARFFMNSELTGGIQFPFRFFMNGENPFILGAFSFAARGHESNSWRTSHPVRL